MTKKPKSHVNTVTISITLAESDIASYFTNPEKLPQLSALYQVFGEHLANLRDQANQAGQGPKKKVRKTA